MLFREHRLITDDAFGGNRFRRGRCGLSFFAGSGRQCNSGQARFCFPIFVFQKRFANDSIHRRRIDGCQLHQRLIEHRLRLKLAHDGNDTRHRIAETARNNVDRLAIEAGHLTVICSFFCR